MVVIAIPYHNSLLLLSSLLYDGDRSLSMRRRRYGKFKVWVCAPGPQNDQAAVSVSRILLMTAVETKGCFGYNDIVSTVRVGGVRFRVHPQDH